MSTATFNKNIIDAINLASKYPAIKRVGIFGSYARGDYDHTSDIDLLYDYDQTSENSTDELLEYVEEIDDIIKTFLKVPKIDYVWYDGVIKSENRKFKEAVLNDVIWIYERA